MIEIIYKDEKQEAKDGEGDFLVPKNIRQIGLVSDSCRIYMEDYVYTFLLRIAAAGKESSEEKSTMAILTGETRWASGVSYVFVKGAIVGDCEELSLEHIEFTDSVWKQIHEELERFFQGQEIVGWFFGEKSLPMEAGDVFVQIHRKHFGGEKVLMLMDSGEREEAFFRYENNFLVKQSGYYLYYEKNPQMQAYMVEKNPDLGCDRAEEVPDEAVKTFRRIIQKKDIEEKPSVFSYAATACLALAVIAAGTRFYQNYQAMQAVNAKTEAVSAMIEEEEDSAGEIDKAEEWKSKTETNTETAKKTEAEISEQPEETQNAESRETSGDPEDTERLLDETSSSILEETSKDPEKKQETDAGNSEAKTISDGDAAIYKEESDVRKAERRVREAHKNNKDNKERQVANSVTEASEQTETTAAEGRNSYIIRPGDTLYQISVEKYGTMEAVSEICRLNELGEDDIIYPGQIIVLP